MFHVKQFARHQQPPALGYRVVLADPPWKFTAHSAKGMGRSPERHYPTMTMREIMTLRQALDFGRILASDCVLYGWTSSTYLEISMACYRAWGFEYKSYAGWRKTGADGDQISGLGYYFGSALELLLVYTRGSPGLPVQRMIPNCFDGPRRAHSEKPDQAYDIIERQYPPRTHGPHLELFYRRERPGWYQWGDGPGGTDGEEKERA